MVLTTIDEYRSVYCFFVSKGDNCNSSPDIFEDKRTGGVRKSPNVDMPQTQYKFAGSYGSGFGSYIRISKIISGLDVDSLC